MTSATSAISSPAEPPTTSWPCPACILGEIPRKTSFEDGALNDRLHGRAIPDLVRLVTISDIHGALIDRRPYKAVLGATEAYGLLAGMTGKLDPDLVRAFQPLALAAAAADLKATA